MSADVHHLFTPVVKSDVPQAPGHVTRILSDIAADLPHIQSISGVVLFDDGTSQSFSSDMTIEDLALSLLVYQAFVNHAVENLT